MTNQSTPAVVGRLETPVRRQRLWIVRVVREVYVLAADEDEASEAVGDIDRWEDAEVDVQHWGGRKLPGWDERCMVYHAGDKDFSLPEAMALDPAA